jgi:Tol biopolymer transport system component
MKRLLTVFTAAVMLVLAVGCTSDDAHQAEALQAINAEVEQLRKELDENKAAMPTATATATATATPTPTPVSRIAFMSDRDGDYDIYVMDADGTHLQQLTDNDDWDGVPAWSPDGKRIAFMSHRDGVNAIFVMDADGTNVQQLTDPIVGTQPSWSPDGNRIAFSSNRDGDFDIFVMDADGTHVQQLTDNDDWDTSPTWSPDGKRIAFSSWVPAAAIYRDGDFHIFVMDADGSHLQQLKLMVSRSDQWDTNPSWSPDGKRIAFARNRYGINAIFVMDADGTNVQQLTEHVGRHAGGDANPTWSPDGKRIAFSSERYGDSEIFVMDSDGTNVVITNQKGSRPDWR